MNSILTGAGNGLGAGTEDRGFFMRKYKVLRWLAVVALMSAGSSPLCAADRTLAEDPFALAQKQSGEQSGGRPWANRSSEELRAWAK